MDTQKRARELYVSVDARGARAWAFADSWGREDVIEFQKNHPMTEASRVRLEALTYHDGAYHTHIIQIGPNFCTFEIAKDPINEPSPTESTLGVCNKLVSDDETVALATSIGLARKEKGFTITEVLQIVRWAEDIRLKEVLLEAVLEGNVLVDIDSRGELVFLAGKDPDGIQK